MVGASALEATPFLIVDTTVMARNITLMQSECDERGVKLRPHVKTHKSTHIARLQLAAGATGLTCATLSEAVGLASAGVVTDLLVAIPVYLDEPKAALAREALSAHTRLLLAVDSVEILSSIAAAGLTTPGVGLMIEVDSGLGRTGLTPEAAAALALSAQVQQGALEVAGFFTHGGHAYSPGASAAAANDEIQSLARAVELAGLTGRADLIVSAGSTPTALLSASAPVNEERPGTYVFGDMQQVGLGQTDIGGVGAVVIATVIHSAEDRYVLDAGAKILTKDRPDWMNSYGQVIHRPRDQIVRVYDNHGVVRCAPGDASPKVGERVPIAPNHICPVVNLVDELVTHDPATGTTGRIPVDLRGHLS